MRLRLEGVYKSFGPTRVLEDVHLEVAAGSIHALLGENGAGKSTLMKIVAGALEPDSGTLKLDDEPFVPRDPASARREGVAIVYQELSVCPHLSVAENILLGSEPARHGFVRRRELHERAHKALATLTRGERTLPLDAPVATLSTGDRQLVEIARALAAENPRLLILDEPTSSLDAGAAERLFAALKALAQRGIAVLYISHFLEEVRRIAESFTVLRDGRHVANGKVATVTNDELVQAMAGRSVQSSARKPRQAGEPLLTVRNLAGRKLPLSASIELYRGEVLGIAGLVGSGRSEFLRALFGLEPVKRGEITLGALTTSLRTPRSSLARGIGFLSEDRKGEGLLLSLSIAHNITLSKLTPLTRYGLLSERAENAAAAKLIERLGIRCRGPEQTVGELSGGNQQKVALARLLYHDVDLFLLDEPTRGIDVRSRSEVHALIGELAERGKAVVLISSQLPELLEVCDRIQVMHRGTLGASHRTAGLSEHELLAEAAGA
ncbi:MAG: sugar ABC transporter ATP-binding protein [Myxococcota bacterium]